MNLTLDQLKGVLQVLVPVLVTAFGAKYIPSNMVTGFDDAIVTIVVTIAATVWSARTTKTPVK